jgi:hypothetical protein
MITRPTSNVLRALFKRMRAGLHCSATTPPRIPSQDDDGFVTGLQYFNEHPRKHYDPVTVCRTDGAASCTTFELPMDPSTGTAVTVTNVKVAKLGKN